MKVYVCDVCQKNTSINRCLGVFPYGNVGITFRKMEKARSEAVGERHLCSHKCAAKFLREWVSGSGMDSRKENGQ